MKVRQYRFQNMVMIGAARRGCGKTKLSCALLSKYHTVHRMIAIKCTTVDNGDDHWHRDQGGMDLWGSPENGCWITRETDRSADKDTARFLRAGAHQVYWLRCRKTKVNDGINALHTFLDPNSLIVCESNSLGNIIEPGLFLMTYAPHLELWKPSALEASPWVDHYIPFERNEFQLNLNCIRVKQGHWYWAQKPSLNTIVGHQSKQLDLCNKEEQNLPVLCLVRDHV